MYVLSIASLLTIDVIAKPGACYSHPHNNFALDPRPIVYINSKFTFYPPLITL